VRTVWGLARDSQPRADVIHDISEARGNRTRYPKVRANPLLNLLFPVHGTSHDFDDKENFIKKYYIFLVEHFFVENFSTFFSKIFQNEKIFIEKSIQKS